MICVPNIGWLKMWRDGLEQSEAELFMASEASAVGNDSEQQLIFPRGSIRTPHTPRHPHFHPLCWGEDKLAQKVLAGLLNNPLSFWVKTILDVHIWWLHYKFLDLSFSAVFRSVGTSNHMWSVAHLSCFWNKNKGTMASVAIVCSPLPK